MTDQPKAFYNEIDDYAADWLENLISRGLIAPGVVDRRSIEDIRPSDLRGYTQVHFFAGIGVWSYAMRRAGIPDSAPIWTGSCPCQPFSAAGKGGGFDDERHLWPHFHYLIEQCRPAVVLGEQVASKDGLAWLDLVQADMEGTGYAFGAVDTCSASVGAPHIRQRLRFAAIRMADSMSAGRTKGWTVAGDRSATGCGSTSQLGHAIRSERPNGEPGICAQHDATGRDQGAATLAGLRSDLRPRPTNGFWSNPDWLICRDGKWRPVESGTFPLAHGAPARVGRLRAYGNAVDAEATAEFCTAVVSTLSDLISLPN